MEKKSRTKKFEYSGKLAEYQTMAQNTTIQYEVDKFTPYQNYLYKRALYGLNGLPKEELEMMCPKKKHRINKVYLKGQNVINIYKQKLTIKYSNLIFNELNQNDNYLSGILGTGGAEITIYTKKGDIEIIGIK